MKLAMVVPGGVDRSGEYRVIPALMALITRLSERHEVHVFAFAQEPRPARWMLAGAHIHNIGGSWRVPRSVAAMIEEHRRARFGLVQAIWSGPVGLTAVIAARLIGAPCVIHLAGGELAADEHSGYGAMLHRRWRIIEPRVLRTADAVTAASAPIVEAAAKLGVDAQRVPLGVDLECWQPLAPRRRDSAAPLRVIHVATLNRVKDQSTLVHALRRVADEGVEFHLDVVGEDTLDGRIQALVADIGLSSRCTFHGFRTQRQLRPLMAAADIHVFSSRHEAGPIVMLEAAIAGVPTVGTRVGHAAEWPGEAVVSVPVGDAMALAEGLRLLATDEPRRFRMAEAAHRLALSEDAAHSAACFERIYAKLVSH